MNQSKSPTAENFIGALNRCREPGAHCATIRLDREPILMYQGHNFWIENLDGFIVAEGPNRGNHLSLPICDIIQSVKQDKPIKVATFDFADTLPKGWLVDLPNMATSMHSPCFDNLTQILRTFIYGEFVASSQRYVFEIAYVSLGSEGGEGGILYSADIFCIRQMRALQKLMHKNGDSDE